MTKKANPTANPNAAQIDARDSGLAAKAVFPIAMDVRVKGSRPSAKQLFCRISRDCGGHPCKADLHQYAAALIV
ncbi:MAG: hypothetical protein V4523_10005 [Pseudomonadota bacterium]